MDDIIVTGEDVARAMEDNEITHVALRTCSICQEHLYYEVHGGELFFNGNCSCTYNKSPLQPRDFDELARMYNTQTTEEGKESVGRLFGLND